jgi:hypothetical protein
MGSGFATGIWIVLSAADGSGTGAVAGVVASPIGAMERFLFEEEFGLGSRNERVGGPPKSFPSSQEFKELSVTTRLVPFG